MTNWKAYILFATILPLVKTENNQRGHKLETTTTLNSQQPYGYEEMSEEHKTEVGNRIEPVIFEPQRKIKLSRSTYKVTSYVDFKPTNNPSNSLDNIWEDFWLISVTPIILVLYIMQEDMRETP